MASFNNAKAVSDYAENSARLVPGLAHLYLMADILLGERVGSDGHVLVVGAGGGSELKQFAESHAGWRFTGVDPSAEMIALAQQRVGEDGSRVDFHEGYIDSAPEGSFDGAVCFLTLHFLAKDERLELLKEVCRRLRPGSPLVVAHHSFPIDEKEIWLGRYAAFAMANGVPEENTRSAGKAIGERLPILSPEEDEALLRAAGFTDVQLFYAAFSFKGWVGYRAV